MRYRVVMTKTQTPPIEATISLTITPYLGDVIEGPAHVVAWLCADGAWVEGARNGFRFEICPDHADPDECGDDCDAEATIYAAAIVSADLDN